MMTTTSKQKLTSTGLLCAFLLLGVACGSSDDNPPPNGTIAAAPTVTATVPFNDAVGVPRNGSINAAFSEAMDPASITLATFSLSQATVAVPGAAAYAGGIATFTPTAPLTAGLLYTMTISTGAKGLANNPLAANYVWSFTTGASSDGAAPTVQSTNPLDGATGVALNQSVTVTFSEAMNPLSLGAETFKLQQGNDTVPAVLTYAGLTATLNPSSAFVAGLPYSASVGLGAQDLAGNALAAVRTWTFTAGTAVDTQAPTVLSTNPADGAVSVAVNRSVTATFSEAMNPTTLTALSFTLAGPGLTSVSGAVTALGTHVTFSPSANLAPDTLFHAALSTGAKDLAGNPLAAAFAWTFTSSAGTSLGPDPVLLGMAGDFVILAKSGIDSVPTSAVTGNIGVSPIDSTAVTGFSLTNDATNQFATSIQVVGQVRAADFASPTPSNLTTAVSDMETAYTDAAGRPTPDHTELGAGEIGGLTLAPGLYKWGTGVSISTDVTLDGGANDTWIFQIAGDITQASGTHVTLTGGALAKNIVWQTFGQVMLGTTAHFEGVVLCQTAIILGTGASVNGRLLAQTAVTLDQNAVTQPAQ